MRELDSLRGTRAQAAVGGRGENPGGNGVGIAVIGPIESLGIHTQA